MEADRHTVFQPGFQLKLNLCKIAQDSKHSAVTQTICTNLMGLFCDAG